MRKATKPNATVPSTYMKNIYTMGSWALFHENDNRNNYYKLPQFNNVKKKIVYLILLYCTYIVAAKFSQSIYIVSAVKKIFYRFVGVFGYRKIITKKLWVCLTENDRGFQQISNGGDTRPITLRHNVNNCFKNMKPWTNQNVVHKCIGP